MRSDHLPIFIYARVEIRTMLTSSLVLLVGALSLKVRNDNEIF